MAAIATAVISAAPILIPLIKDLVLGIEKLFGPKTGPTKLEAVVDSAQVVADKLSTAGKINGLLTREQIVSLAEGVVQILKSQGLLADGPTTPTTTTTPKPGQKVRIEGIMEVL